MVTDELVGLPVELRKEAKPMLKWLMSRQSAKDSFSKEQYDKIMQELWLPAGLVAKEIRKIRQIITEHRDKCLKNSTTAKVSDCAYWTGKAQGYSNVLLWLENFSEKKVEEAFGK